MSVLDDLRNEIDATDEQIVALLNARAALAQRVGAAKAGTAIFQPGREAQVLEHVTMINKGPLSQADITTIYHCIIKACRQIQTPS